LKLNIRKRSAAASDINLFKQKVNGAIDIIDPKVMQTLMRKLKGIVRQFGHGQKSWKKTLFILNF
jgi:hypothetical protein